MKKKITALMLVAVFAFCFLFGCTPNNADPTTQSNTSGSSGDVSMIHTDTAKDSDTDTVTSFTDTQGADASTDTDNPDDAIDPVLERFDIYDFVTCFSKDDWYFASAQELSMSQLDIFFAYFVSKEPWYNDFLWAKQVDARTFYSSFYPPEEAEAKIKEHSASEARQGAIPLFIFYIPKAQYVAVLQKYLGVDVSDRLEELSQSFEEYYDPKNEMIVTSILGAFGGEPPRMELVSEEWEDTRVTLQVKSYSGDFPDRYWIEEFRFQQYEDHYTLLSYRLIEDRLNG